MQSSDPKDNMREGWHAGKEIIQDDNDLVIHETKASGPNSRDANEPDYSVDESYETGGFGPNPWREK